MSDEATTQGASVDAIQEPVHATAEEPQHAPSGTNAPRPKRVLTEAQRLAFLKGREKRMANIAARRAAKSEETLSIPAEESSAPVPVKPLPKSPINRPVTPDPNDLANRVAHLVYEKLNSEEVTPPSTPVKPKRKYTRKAPEFSADNHLTQTPATRQFNWL